MPEPDDQALVARLRQGDERAWAEFLDRYERLIYSVPRRMGFDADESADVFQDVVVAFLSGLTRLRDSRTLPRWLAQTAFRIARDKRTRGRREVRPHDDAFWETVADPGPDVTLVLAAFEARREVQAGLKQVSPRCRELLTLLFLSDPTPSYAEIAHRLSEPKGSLGPTRQRCLASMLKALKKRGIKAPAESTLESNALTPHVRTRSTR